MGHNSSGDSGWGFDLEREVSCALLVLMAARGCLWMSDEEEIVSVWPQVHQDVKTDDIMVCLKNRHTGTVRNLYIQCKSTIRCNRSKSGEFYKAVSRAFCDYTRKDNPGNWLFAIACAPLLRESSTLPDFIHAMHERTWVQVREELRGDRLEPEYKKWYELFLWIAKTCESGSNVSQELVHKFLQHYYVLQPDIQYRFGFEESFILSALLNLGLNSPRSAINVVRGVVADKAKAKAYIERDELLRELNVPVTEKSTNAGAKFQLDLANSLEGYGDGTPRFGTNDQTIVDKISRDASLLEDIFSDVKFAENDNSIKALFLPYNDRRSLYELLRVLARYVISERTRLEASRVGIRLLAYQLRLGNHGIVFDFFAYLLCPEIELDSKGKRWRIDWLKLLFKFDGDVSWKILCSQVVTVRMQPISFLDYPHRPMDIDLLASYQDYALELAEKDVPKIIDLVRRLPLLDPKFFDRILGHIRNSRSLFDKGKADCVCEALLNSWVEVVEWPFFVDDKNERSNAIFQLAEMLLGDKTTSLLIKLYCVYDGSIANLDELRRKYLQKYILDYGADFETIKKLSAQVRHPSSIGATLAKIKSADYDYEFFGEILEESREWTSKDMSQTYAWYRYLHEGGMSWARRIEKICKTKARLARFYSMLPVVPDVWERVETVASKEADVYWKNIKIYLPDPDIAKQCAHVVQELSRCGRTIDALRMWSYLKTRKVNVPYSILVSMLDAFVNGSQSMERLEESIHLIQEALKDLHTNAEKDIKIVSEIEWYFNVLVGKRTIERIDFECGNIRMATDAGFFVDVVRGLSNGKNAPKTIDYSRGTKVLNAWSVFPGINVNLSEEQVGFKQWIKAMMQLTVNDKTLRNKCYKWLGACLAKVQVPVSDISPMSEVWDFVNGEEGRLIRHDFEKALKEYALLPHLFSGKESKVSIKEEYLRLDKEAQSCGYHNIALAYERAYRYLDAVHPLS